MKRAYHDWQRWECVSAGMYESSAPPPMDSETAVGLYAAFLRDLGRFNGALIRVATEWPISCEQFLTNQGMNRIAWLGQASMCIATGVPACFRGGFKRLTNLEQNAANVLAYKHLKAWERAYNAEANRAVRRNVEATRLLGGYTGRGTSGVAAPGTGSVLQGNLFGDPR